MKINKRKYLIILLLLITWLGYGQMKEPGSVMIQSDQRLEDLVDLHISYNEAFPVMPGYRIQIFMKSGNQALSLAEEEKVAFNEKYEDVNAYLMFTAPYYRVRVGDFRTRLEAEKFLKLINKNYPNAWVIRDDINFPDLSINQNTYEDE